MTLLDLAESAVAEVTACNGGRVFAQRLQGFGICPGHTVRVVRAAPFGGPLLIEDVASGARLMIGRGMAAKIEVRDGCAAGP
jgi:ferrous iron transport protein A